MSQKEPSRRAFLSTAAMTAASMGVTGAASTASAQATAAAQNDASDSADRPHRLCKAVKFSMIHENLSIEDKFKLVLDLGFDGVELDSPSNLNRREVVEARDKTGIIIHGVVCSTHWNVRHSDPDPNVRARAMENLKTAIQDARIYGGDTVLLVPGAVRHPENENFVQVWERSSEAIREVIPFAQKHCVRIAIETVWNDFITTPQQLVQYIDQFASPWVGAYLDASNMIKFGVPGETWMRMLNTRLLKLDIKGYHVQRQWVPIGEGSENYPEQRRALREIGYYGWATAEVGGGNREHLKRIAEAMDKHLMGL